MFKFEFRCYLVFCLSTIGTWKSGPTVLIVKMIARFGGSHISDKIVSISCCSDTIITKLFLNWIQYSLCIWSKAYFDLKRYKNWHSNQIHHMSLNYLLDMVLYRNLILYMGEHYHKSKNSIESQRMWTALGNFLYKNSCIVVEWLNFLLHDKHSYMDFRNGRRDMSYCRSILHQEHYLKKN